MVLDIKVGSKLGTGLDRGCRTVVLLDIKVGSKLGTGLDRGCCTAVVLDIKVGSKLGTILGIALATELGTTFGLELGAAKSKMNISVPTGNRRLWQEEDMKAFVQPSLLSVTSTEALFDVKGCTVVVDNELGSTLGTVLDKGLGKVDNKVVPK